MACNDTTVYILTSYMSTAATYESYLGPPQNCVQPHYPDYDYNQEGWLADQLQKMYRMLRAAQWTTNIYLTVFLSLIFVSGLTGNILVLIVFSQSKVKQASTILIMGLATNDLIICAIVLPGVLLKEWYVPFQWDIVCKGWEWVRCATIPLSSLILMVVAIERYLLICRVGEAKPMSARQARYTILSVAVISVCHGVPAMLRVGVYQADAAGSTFYLGLCLGNDLLVSQDIVDNYWKAMTAEFLMILVVVVVMYCLVFRTVYKQNKRWPDTHKNAGVGRAERTPAVVSDVRCRSRHSAHSGEILQSPYVVPDTERDIQNDTHRNIRNDTKRDNMNDTHRNIWNDTQRDITNDTEKDIQNYTQRDIMNDITQNKLCFSHTKNSLHELKLSEHLNIQEINAPQQPKASNETKLHQICSEANNDPVSQITIAEPIPDSTSQHQKFNHDRLSFATRTDCAKDKPGKNHHSGFIHESEFGKITDRANSTAATNGIAWETTRPAAAGFKHRRFWKPLKRLYNRRVHPITKLGASLTYLRENKRTSVEESGRTQQERDDQQLGKQQERGTQEELGNKQQNVGHQQQNVGNKQQNIGNQQQNVGKQLLNNTQQNVVKQQLQYGKQQQKLDKQQQQQSKQQKRYSTAQVKTAKVLLLVTIVYIVSFAPVLLMILGAIPSHPIPFYGYFIHSTANPLIYSFINQVFRKQLQNLLARKLWRDKPTA